MKNKDPIVSSLLRLGMGAVDFLLFQRTQDKTLLKALSQSKKNLEYARLKHLLVFHINFRQNKLLDDFRSSFFFVFNRTC